jgi:hypothetical protein
MMENLQQQVTTMSPDNIGKAVLDLIADEKFRDTHKAKGAPLAMVA